MLGNVLGGCRWMWMFPARFTLFWYRVAYNFLIYLHPHPSWDGSLLVFLFSRRKRKKINKHYLIWWMLCFMCEFLPPTFLCIRGFTKTDGGGAGKWKTLSISFVCWCWSCRMEKSFSQVSQPQDKFLDKQPDGAWKCEDVTWIILEMLITFLFVMIEICMKFLHVLEIKSVVYEFIIAKIFNLHLLFINLQGLRVSLNQTFPSYISAT